jgi:hypothetical protein
MKFIDMVVGPDLTLDWYQKKNRLYVELNAQFVRGTVSISKFEEFVFKGDKATRKMNSRPPNEQLDAWENLLSILDYKLKSGMIFLPQVQLFIEHQNPFDYDLLSKKIKFPTIYLIGFDSLRLTNMLQKGDCFAENSSVSLLLQGDVNLNYDIVFFNACEDIKFFEKKDFIKRKKENNKSLWFLVDKWISENTSFFDDPQTEKEIPQFFEKKRIFYSPFLEDIIGARNEKNIPKLLGYLSR